MKNDLILLFLEEYEKDLDNFIYKNLFYKQYFWDLKQEILLCFCELSESKLMELFITDGMLNYCKVICINLFNNTYLPYHKHIRIKDDYNIEIDLKKDDDFYLYIKEVNENTNDFFTELYIYYVMNKISIKDISNDLKISRYSIMKKFLEIKNKLKEKYGKERAEFH